MVPKKIEDNGYANIFSFFFLGGGGGVKKEHYGPCENVEYHKYSFLPKKIVLKTAVIQNFGGTTKSIMVFF